MIGQKEFAGLCLLCVLAVTAFAASSASAAVNGTTAFTCNPVAIGGASTRGFKDAHCKEAAEGTAVKFEHVAIAEGTNTSINGGNANTTSDTTGAEKSILHVTTTGIELKVTATTVSLSGSMVNKLEGGEHVIHGTGVITYEGVTVDPEQCSVAGGKIVTKELTATTLGQGMGVKIQPVVGNVLAEFTVEGPTCPEAEKGLVKVTGSLVATPEGATLTTTRAGITAQGTLKVRNVIAGLEGKVTIKNSNSGTPLTATTVET